jgi:beta-glucosidase/6-phospho-beta-glucosidase/beta-galactosidase
MLANYRCDGCCALSWLRAAAVQDLPQVLQDKYGGFLSPQIQTDFLYYAGTLFKHLGDIVDQWMTFNEVISICELGYQVDVFAPQANKGLGAKYTCGHNVLLAHAKTMQLYRWARQHNLTQ